MQTSGIYNRRQTDVLHTLFRGENKIRVENEINLPDYCSDVNRIIRTDVKLKQNEKKLTAHSGGLLLQIDGVAIFNCIYAADARGSEGRAESFTFYSDFSHTFKVPVDANDGFDLTNVAAYTDFAWENANGKLLGPRKLILRTDVVVSAVLKANRSFVYYEKTGAGDDLQTRVAPLNTTALIGTDEREFTVTERISIPSDSPAIGRILDCDAGFFCEKCSSGDGSVSFEGLISLSCLYAAEGDGNCFGILQPIEFEQGFELAEAKGDAVVEVALYPTLLKVDFDMDESGENRLLLLELHYKAATYLYKNETVLAANDCFSIQNNLTVSSEKAGVEELRALSLINTRQSLRIPISNEEVADIQSMKGRIDFKDCRLAGDGVEVSAKLKLFMIGQRPEGSLLPMDESIDLEMTFPAHEIGCVTDGCSRVELGGGLKSVECRIDGNDLAIDADMQCRIGLFAKNDSAFIHDIEVLSEKEGDAQATLTFFYPDEGESLWDVAKRFNIPENKLLENNAVNGDQLPKTLLIFK